MVSFWDHMKSVLKTIKKKKTRSCPGKWRDPGQEPSSVCHVVAEQHWLAPIPSLAPLLGGWWGQVQRPVTVSFVSSNFPPAFSVCGEELGEPHLGHRWSDHALLMSHHIEPCCLQLLSGFKMVVMEIRVCVRGAAGSRGCWHLLSSYVCQTLCRVLLYILFISWNCLSMAISLPEIWISPSEIFNGTMESLLIFLA